MSASEKEFLTPQIISLVEHITRRRLNGAGVAVRQEQKSVINVILFKIYRWAGKNDLNSQHLLRGVVKITNETCFDVLRKAANHKTDSLDDHPDLAIQNSIIGNTAAETNSLSLKLWEELQHLSYRQFVSLLFKFEQDEPNFLLGLIRQRLVPLDDLANRLGVSDDTVRDLIVSLPWTIEKIAVFIRQHENKECTTSQVSAARRDGRKKIIK